MKLKKKKEWVRTFGYELHNLVIDQHLLQLDTTWYITHDKKDRDEDH